MDLETENKLFEIVGKIREWDPDEDSAETLLNFYDEFERVKPENEINLDKYTDITNLGVAKEYQKRVDRISSYLILACDFDGNCIVSADEWYIENIDDIEEE